MIKSDEVESRNYMLQAGKLMIALVSIILLFPIAIIAAIAYFIAEPFRKLFSKISQEILPLWEEHKETIKRSTDNAADYSKVAVGIGGFLSWLAAPGALGSIGVAIGLTSTPFLVVIFPFIAVVATVVVTVAAVVNLCHRGNKKRPQD